MEQNLLEVCVDTVSSLQAAIKGGAGRIELCSALDMGGLTPTHGLMEYAKKSPIPVYVMIRPRGGNFHFTDDEIKIMLTEIDAVQCAGLAGVVLGISNFDDTLNLDALKTLITAADGLGKTLHRVFDLTPNLHNALKSAIDLGFERILTSGGQKTAFDGADVLRTLIKDVNKWLSIMPGSGVTIENANLILEKTGAFEIHASCRHEAFIKASKKQIELGYGSNIKEATSQDVSALVSAITQKI